MAQHTSSPQLPFPSHACILHTATGEEQRAATAALLLKHIPSLDGKLDNEPDITWIEDEKALGIEQIRNLKAWVQEKPYAQSWKLAILLHADTLTTEAQNAALKILEEPPSYAYIVLVTAKPFALQATVRSRCSILSAGIPSDTPATVLTLPLTIADAFAATEPLAKDRAEAIQFFERALLEQHAQLREKPSTSRIHILTSIQHTLLLLKRNVNVRLAVEAFFLGAVASHKANV